ncbi:MAG: OmpP1/FadL family transporter [Alphaproteobacteria bacterium]
MRLQKSLFVIGLMCTVGAMNQANAAGFYIQEQSVKGQGAAFAGAAANPADAAVIFNNPAAMTALSGPQVVAGGAVIIPKSSLTNQGSTATGNNGGNPFDPALVPSLYVAYPFSGGTFWAGLAVTAPFGLANEYDSGWFGRYNSTENMLRTMDIAPSFAVKLTDKVSLGGGIDFQLANAKLDQAVFTGGPDALAEVKGDSWKTGFNLGVFWEPDAATRLGLHYRSAITQNIEGHLVVTGIVPVTPATAKLKLPEVVEFGITHDFSPQLKVMGSFNWFGWDNFNEIRVQSSLPDNVTAQNWRNTYAVALGAEWKQDEKWTYRGGVQFDQTPTGALRDTRVPDSNRFWLSLGGSYVFNSRFSIDAAASHIFMSDTDLSVTNQFGVGPIMTTSASVENQVDIISLQGVLKF